MYRVIALTALAAVAAAQSPELQSNDGSINMETREGVTVTRRQQISVFDLSNAVTELRAENSNLRVQMTALGGDNSPLALGVQAIANDMQARTIDLVTTAATNTNRLNSLETAVSATVATMTTTMDSRINAVLGSLASTATELTASSASTATALRAEQTTTVAALTASSASTATALRAEQTSGASTLTAAVNTQLTRVNTSIRAMTVTLAGKRSAASNMWFGSCSNNGNGGWRDYCFNRVTHDTSRPYFRKENDTRMRTILAGYYHTQFHRRNQTCNWAYTLLYYDGQHRIHTSDWQGGNSRWRDSENSMVYPLAANKQFYAKTWNGCWSNWHTAWYHTHFFAMYVGAIPA